MSYVDIPNLAARLTDRDRLVLDDLEKHRLLSTRNIQALHFRVGAGNHLTIGAATKATTRVLQRLHAHHIISHLQRRIGGVRHGSQGNIWQLSSTGDRVQRFFRGEPGRTRYTEPSSLFTSHTLAVSSLVVQLRTLESEPSVELLSVEPEPQCWREYTGPQGTVQTLKPDLSAVTASGDFEDHWFIEADEGTEHLPQILAKCRSYASYAASGIEQHRLGVFPAVVWVTKDGARAASLSRAVASTPGLPVELFRFTTTENFIALITSGGAP